MKYLKFIDYGDAAAPLKVISLHGFPSIRSKQNREIAQGIATELSCRVRVVLYPGLSCDGLFSFKKTIDALVEEFPSLISENAGTKKIDLLGHSFGGFCSLILASKYPQLIERVVLLSPLLQFSSSVKDVSAFFTNLLEAAVGTDVSTLPPEQLAKEFRDLSQKYSTVELIDKLDTNLKVTLMQARADAVTPTAIAEEFRKHFKCNFDFELVEQDHSFLIDRPKLSKQIAKHFI